MSNIFEKNDMTLSFGWPLHEFPDFKLLYTLESVWRLSHPNLIKANKRQSGVLPLKKNWKSLLFLNHVSYRCFEA